MIHDDDFDEPTPKLEALAQRTAPWDEPQPTPLHEAADSGATVTIALADGRLLTGTVHPHRTEPGYYVLRNGRRGRPPVFHEDDVEEVIFE